MEALGKVIGQIAQSNDKLLHQDALEGATYNLAHALRDGIDLEWGASAGFRTLQPVST